MTGTAEIIAIGNEILIGDVLDTNTHWLCQQITRLGGEVGRAVIVRDDLDVIGRELLNALGRAPDIVFTIGGLGPTLDDMTLVAVSQATERPLSLHDRALKLVRGKYRELADEGYVDDPDLTEERRKMARLPQGAKALANPVGGAPGVLLEEGKTTVVCLPGVPDELKGIFEGELAATLEGAFGGLFRERVVVTESGDESALAPAVRQVAEAHPEVYVKSRARRFGPDVRIHVTLSASGSVASKVEALLDAALDDLKAGLGERQIGIDAVELESREVKETG